MANDLKGTILDPQFINKQLEDQVIATLLFDDEREPYIFPRVCHLQPEHFITQNNRQVFTKAMEMWRSGKPVNLTTIYDALNLQTNQDLWLWITEITSSNFRDTPFNGVRAAEVVYRLGRIRELQLEIRKAQLKITPQSTPEEILGWLSEIVTTGSADGDSQKLYSLPALASQIIQNVEDRETLQITVPPGVKTGLEVLDSVMPGGLPKKSLTLIGGRTSTGKTTLALQIANHVAESNPVIFATAEMAAEQLAMRSITYHTGLPIKTFARRMSQGDYLHFQHGMVQVATSQLWILDAIGCDIDRLYNRLLQAYHRVKPVLIIVDYLQLIARSAAANGKINRYQATGDTSTRLKTMAGNFDLPVIALSQVSRDNQFRNKIQGREDPRKKIWLKMSDFRDSGNLEEDTDQALLLQSPAGREEGISTLEVTLDLVKDRIYGPLKRMDYDYNVTTGRFTLQTGIQQSQGESDEPEEFTPTQDKMPF
jgi:replicative DNA helicase